MALESGSTSSWVSQRVAALKCKKLSQFLRKLPYIFIAQRVWLFPNLYRSVPPTMEVYWFKNYLVNTHKR